MNCLYLTLVPLGFHIVEDSSVAEVILLVSLNGVGSL